MKIVEEITFRRKILAYIISGKRDPEKTTFVTPPSSNLQLGFVVYNKEQSIPPHIHRRVLRRLDRTEEVLVVEKGSCIIDIYNNGKKQIASRKLNKGDIIVLVGGGHGFRMLKNTRFLEIKQGPYAGLSEKERF